MENLLNNELLTRLKDKSEIAQIIESSNDYKSVVPQLIEIILTCQNSSKFSAEKTLRKISEVHPEAVYDYFDSVIKMIDNDNHFIKWGGILILSNMFNVDTEHKFESVYEHYFDLINTGSMITACNVIKNAWRYVLQHNECESDLTQRLLNTANQQYFAKNELSLECKNIVMGNVIECFEHYFGISTQKEAMLNFARTQINNSRKSVAKRAMLFLECFDHVDEGGSNV